MLVGLLLIGSLSDHNNKKVPRAIKISPMLNATVNPGKVSWSESQARRVSETGKIQSLVRSSLWLVMTLSGERLGSIRRSVSGLIGIQPPFRTITVKFASKPNPIAQNPGWRIFTAAKTSSIACEPTRIKGLTASGISLPVAGI